MRKCDRKALIEYVRSVAGQLELRDWTIVIERQPCDPEKMGDSVCIDGQKQAHLSFGAGFRDYSPEDQRETVVHELLHVHHWVCWRMVQSDLSEPLGKIAYYVFCDSYRRAMEYQTDALSKALARHLPLIEWPK